MIATCLASHVIPSSSFLLMPQSNNKWSTSHHTCQVGPKSGHYSSCNRSLISAKLSTINTSNESGSNESTALSSQEQPNIDQMTLSQILHLLNRLNIRYAPDAKRSELEELLYRHYKSATTISASESSQSTSQSRRRRQRSPPSPSSSPSASVQNNGISNNIVDAIVLEEDDEALTGQESYKHRIKSDEYDRHQSSNYDRSRETMTGKTTNRSTRRSSNQQSEYHRHRRRRRNNYDLYNRNYLGVKSMRNGRDKDMIGTFDIPDNDERSNKYYDNGMQIFLMGFLEAGKTATQLALGSVANAVVKPFSGEERWYDEERGREVLDVNILDYSPDYGRRTQRRYSSDGAGRRRRRRSGTSRMEQGYDDNDDSVGATRNATRRRRSVGRRSHSSTDDGREIRTLPDQPLPFPAVGYSKDDDPTRNSQMNVGRRRDDTKPIYGLYNGNTRDQPVSDSITNVTEHRSEVHPQPRHKQPKKVWKKRLRKKFDIALGLQSPISSSSSEKLYDSWKTQVDGVHDGRKEVLRREMEVQKLSPTSPSPNKRNNRRARMRAKSSVRQEVGKAAKSYLDEPPFWRRDGGTIASVLFDSQPPQGSTPTGKGVQSRPKRKYNNSLDTLEAILRSPLGRQNTVTSLVAFIARYSLSWFGSLCRWAGVRGTIPQPIVVTAVFAMGISSRRGYRGLSVCLSLLALRLVGEFIHGSLHGNEFWEDEYSKESHEWTRE